MRMNEMPNGMLYVTTCATDLTNRTNRRSTCRKGSDLVTIVIWQWRSRGLAIDFQEAVGAPLVISGMAQGRLRAHSPHEQSANRQMPPLHRGGAPVHLRIGASGC